MAKEDEVDLCEFIQSNLRRKFGNSELANQNFLKLVNNVRSVSDSPFIQTFSKFLGTGQKNLNAHILRVFLEYYRQGGELLPLIDEHESVTYEKARKLVF